MLKVDNVSFYYNKKNIIKDVSFSVEKGEFVGIIGPNGSGKSTVLKNVYRSLTPKSGEVYIDGTSLNKLSYKESAKKMAVVGQENELNFDFTVSEIVAMGRNPHKKLFDVDTEQDMQIIFNAMKSMGIESLSKDSYLHLSGGEKQRVIIARAIAQDTDFIILDEPTNHLDINYQLQIFELIKSLNITVLSAIHDLNMASLFCDKLIVMQNGRIVLQGTPKEVLTVENIYNIYGVNTHIEENQFTSKLTITYLPKGK